MGKWRMTCPKGADYEAECSHEGRNVQCHITKQLNPEVGGCIIMETEKVLRENPKLSKSEAEKIAVVHLRDRESKTQYCLRTHWKGDGCKELNEQNLREARG